MWCYPSSHLKFPPLPPSNARGTRVRPQSSPWSFMTSVTAPAVVAVRALDDDDHDVYDDEEERERRKRARRSWRDYPDHPPRHVASCSTRRKRETRPWTSLGSAAILQYDTAVVRSDMLTPFNARMKHQTRHDGSSVVIRRHRLPSSSSRRISSSSGNVRERETRFVLPVGETFAARLGASPDHFVTLRNDRYGVHVWEWCEGAATPRVVRRYAASSLLYVVDYGFMTVVSLKLYPWLYFVVEKPPLGDVARDTVDVVAFDGTVPRAMAPWQVSARRPRDYAVIVTRGGILVRGDDLRYSVVRWDRTVALVAGCPQYVLCFAASPSGRHFALMTNTHEVVVFVCPSLPSSTPRVLCRVRMPRAYMHPTRLSFTSELTVDFSGGGQYRRLRLYHNEEQSWWMIASVWAGARTYEAVAAWRERRRARQLEDENENSSLVRRRTRRPPRPPNVVHGVLPDVVVTHIRSYLTGSLDAVADGEYETLRAHVLTTMCECIA